MYNWARQVSRDTLILAEDVGSAARSLPAIDMVGLACLTLFATILRLRFLLQPMRDDQAYRFLAYSSHPFYVALSFYNAPNNHLFHTLLVRLLSGFWKSCLVAAFTGTSGGTVPRARDLCCSSESLPH